MCLLQKCLEKLSEIINRLCSIFKMKNLGQPDTYLSIKIIIERENRILSLQQKDYTDKSLARFNMTNCTAKDTPL